VQLAHQAAALPGRDIFVAGSLSPLEDCYRPDLVPDDAALAREHGAQARFLAEAGVDLILAETHNTIREAVAAVRAAKATGVPVFVSLVTDGKGASFQANRSPTRRRRSCRSSRRARHQLRPRSASGG
jgi:S-methylmethionine-dependent homocysteine/selenocysteine methylase